ncbi:MAG: type II secretion system protein N [Sphingopyxis sp.]
MTSAAFVESIRGGGRRAWNALRQRGLAGLLLALLGIALIIQIVRLVYVALSPIGAYGNWAPTEVTTFSPEERAALFARIDPFYRTIANSAAGPANITGLPLQLFGIRINEGAGTGSAIIAGEDGTQNSIGVGEEIQTGVRLAAVHFDYIEIDNGGRRELLYLDQSQASASAPASGPGAAHTPAAAAPAAANAAASPAIPISPASLRAGIGFAPRQEDGRVTGIIVREQGDGSAFQAAGFRGGDIIRSVNGRPIGSPSDLTALSNQLTPGARLSLTVERGAGTVPIAIIIPSGNP